MVASLSRMHHAVDPRTKITDAIGDLSEAEVMLNDVLVGVYLRPDTMELSGGKKLFLADTGIREEDKFQGKVGLVLKKGPLAFVDDDQTQFAGQTVEVGDWVVFHSADGWSLTIKGTLCRMVKDHNIRMIVRTPDFVY